MGTVHADVANGVGILVEDRELHWSLNDLEGKGHEGDATTVLGPRVMKLGVKVDF